MNDLREVFRPAKCPTCSHELRYDDDLGIATCPSCRSMWLTERKPKTDYRALSYQLVQRGATQQERDWQDAIDRDIAALYAAPEERS